MNSYPNSTALKRPADERRARWTWTAVIVGFLGMQVALGGTAIFLATSDPSMAVVPDYEKKSLAWDDELAMRAVGRKLAWQVAIDLDPQADAKGQRMVRLVVTDRDGAPVAGAAANLQLYHHARAGEVLEPKLREAVPGVYQGLAPIHRPGLWQFSLDLRRDSERFRYSQQHELRGVRMAPEVGR